MWLVRLFPGMAEAGAIAAQADAMLVPGLIAGEVATFSRPSARGASRPYGWAWLLALHGELVRHDGRPWAAAVAPLARLLAGRMGAYLTTMTYPIRVGTHFNSAFAMLLALGWARTHDPALATTITRRAVDWYGADRAAQAWEPGGDEFLSGTLIEALLMAAVLPTADYRVWLDGFLPALHECRPATLFSPAIVSDRTDGKIAHLDGLNLSRAWCWRGIAAAVPGHPAAVAMDRAATDHLAAALPHIAADYMGEHWLATYAVLALRPRESPSVPFP